MSGRWLRWFGRFLEYAVAGLVGLVVAVPVLPIVLLLLALLVGSGLALLGLFSIPAVIVSRLLHEWVGLPFWCWMIPSCLGAVVCYATSLAALWNAAGAESGTVQPRTHCSPWLWLAAGVLLGQWWWGGDGGSWGEDV